MIGANLFACMAAKSLHELCNSHDSSRGGMMYILKRKGTKTL